MTPFWVVEHFNVMEHNPLMQGNRAVKVTSKVQGLRKIVQVFEYVDLRTLPEKGG